MTELNLDAESITRNKTYNAIDHLLHLIKIGWSPDSPLIKSFIKENNLTEQDLANTLSKVSKLNSKECCTNRN